MIRAAIGSGQTRCDRNRINCPIAGLAICQQSEAVEMRTPVPPVDTMNGPVALAVALTTVELVADG